MRIVKRSELMNLPVGTLFCPLKEHCAFGQICIKEETVTLSGGVLDFYLRELDRISADTSWIEFGYIEEMFKDSTISYPAESAPGLEGHHQAYLVYEQQDIDALVSDLSRAYKIESKP